MSAGVWSRRLATVIATALVAGTLVMLSVSARPAGAAVPATVTTAGSTYARVYGSGPLADVLYWADQKKRCGLTRDQLAAMMLVPNYTETGAGTANAPSPMTLSRWDTQAGLYPYGDKATPFPKAFFHPGIGMWQFDSAGGWNLTAAGAISAYTAAQTAAEVLASRWCTKQSRAYAWAPWYYCGTTSICEDLYAEIFDGTQLVNVSQDLTVTRDGGMQTRSCSVWSIGSVACSYVDPAKAEGYKSSWVGAGAGPSPITAPFYVFAYNGYEFRYWLAQDTGYPVTLRASKPITANARTSLTWEARDDLCDMTAVRGACDRSPFGRLDAASGGAGSIALRGWVIDPDTNGPVTVHVYVDGRITAALTADQPRPDLTVPFPTFGPNHGFSGTLTGLSGGSHTVCTYGINVGAGGNTTLGCASVLVPTGSPFGNLEAVSAGAGSILVKGWAIDPDVVAPIPVHVYVDGVGAGVGAADQTRTDVAAAFPVYGAAHGFSLLVGGALRPGPHSVCVYGINTGGGANATIGCATVTVPTGNPFGALDTATSGFGSVTVRGWAIDPDSTGPVLVHVYVDGVGLGATTAGGTRPDVGAAFGVFGANHGFEATFTPVGGGPHTVCAYGINVGAGGNGTLGCRTFTASGDPGGALDSASTAPGTVTVSGWAIDPDTVGPATVKVLVDGVALGTATADWTRPDIAALLPGYGADHGFEATVSGVGGGPHDVCAVAVNTVGTGADQQLGCTRVQASGEPFGNLDEASSAANTISVRGWGIDPDTVDPTTIHVYIDGVGAAIVGTGAARADVFSRWPFYGLNRGFTATIGGVAPGPHTVCAYAINTGPGSGNTTLGCLAV